MNFNISRNLKERNELLAQAREMEGSLKLAIDALPDTLTDNEWDAALERLEQKYDTKPLFLKALALEYKECRNDWFRKFVLALGVCENHRITRKMGEILAKYSEPNHDPDTGRGANYFVRVGDLFIHTVLFSIHEPAYVTIKQI